MKPSRVTSALAFALAVLLSGCEDSPAGPERYTEAPAAAAQAYRGAYGASYTFEAAVFDIAATPDGSILVAQNTTVKEIDRKGHVGEVITVPTVAGSPINGLEAIGRRSFFATSGGLDAAVGAGLWRVSEGVARKVVDIEAFEQTHDPDVSVWKDARCEEPEFTAGPQSNPYHLAALSGNEALVADAAGNALLWGKSNGEVDWVAVLTPPTDESGDYRVLKTLADGTDCYVQPVPTSVAIGPDGAYYVGELTGATAEGLHVGLSRVWRIEPGARNVVCPSAACEVVISGMTSVIDLAFGPDGKLYVLEYDENSWLAPFIPSVPLGGGTINRCDVDTGRCDAVVQGLTLPGAITFDKWGDLGIVENNITAPTVHRVNLR